MQLHVNMSLVSGLINHSQCCDTVFVHLGSLMSIHTAFMQLAQAVQRLADHHAFCPPVTSLITPFAYV